MGSETVSAEWFAVFQRKNVSKFTKTCPDKDGTFNQFECFCRRFQISASDVVVSVAVF